MRLRRRQLLALGLAALAAGPASALAQGLAPGTQVRVATEGAFPPFNALDDAGNPIGFEIDLAQAICARQGLDLVWVLTPWSDMIPGLLRGDFDVIMAGMGITPGRAARVAFGREYFDTGMQAAGMYVGTHTFQNPRDGTIAVQSGTIHEAHLAGLGARLLSFDTAGQALDAVLDGRADVTFGSPDFLEQKVWRTSRALAILGTEEIDAGGAAAAFRPEDNVLRLAFDQALAALAGDGTIDRLRDKWFLPSRDI